MDNAVSVATMTGSNGIMGMFGVANSYSYYFYLKIPTAKQAVGGDRLALMFKMGENESWQGFICDIANPKSTPGLTRPFAMTNADYLLNKAAGKFEKYDLAVFEWHESYCSFDQTSYITLEARRQSYEKDTNTSDTTVRFAKGENIRFAYWQNSAAF